jgi:hypothetical protein
MRKVVVVASTMAILLSGLHVQAEQLYKIVDENGKVTFSQYPPKSGGNVKVEEKKTTENASPLREDGDFQYCGGIRLPSPTSAGSDHYSYSTQSYPNSSQYYSNNTQQYGGRTDLYLKDILTSRERWQNELSSLEKSTDSRIYSQFENNRQKMLNDRRYGGRSSAYRSQYEHQNDERTRQAIESGTARMKDLRCAINWASDKDDAVESFQTAKNEEIKSLEKMLSNARQRRDAACGQEPPFNLDNPSYKQDKKKWDSCSKQHNDDIADVQQKIKAANYNLDITKK